MSKSRNLIILKRFSLRIGSIRRDCFAPYGRSSFSPGLPLHTSRCPMPTLTLVSVYNARKATYSEQLARSRAELRAVRGRPGRTFRSARPPTPSGCRRGGPKTWFSGVEVPKLTQEGYAAVETLGILDRKVKAVVRKIRTPTAGSMSRSSRSPCRRRSGCRGDRWRSSTSTDGRLSLARRAGRPSCSQHYPAGHADRRPGVGMGWFRGFALPPSARVAEGASGQEGQAAALLRTATTLEEDVRYGR